MLHLAINFREAVWHRFHSWMRTMDKHGVPSEHVVAETLRSDLPEYLLRAPVADLLRKMIVDNIDPDQAPSWLTLDELAA